jgi:hypothetical protein
MLFTRFLVNRNSFKLLTIAGWTLFCRSA